MLHPVGDCFTILHIKLKLFYCGLNATDLHNSENFGFPAQSLPTIESQIHNWKLCQSARMQFLCSSAEGASILGTKEWKSRDRNILHYRFKIAQIVQ